MAHLMLPAIRGVHESACAGRGEARGRACWTGAAGARQKGRGPGRARARKEDTDRVGLPVDHVRLRAVEDQPWIFELWSLAEVATGQGGCWRG